MANKYTSEEALNGILNILETAITNANKAKTPDKNQVSDDLKDLLKGTIAGQSKNLSIGEQVEKLAQGLGAMKKNNITEKQAKDVVGIIKNIGESISSLKINKNNMEGMFYLI